MFCANCGKEMNETDAFCPFCGAPNEAEKTSEVPENNGAVPISQQIEPIKTAKKSKAKPIIICIALIAFFVSLFFIVKHFLPQNDDLENSDTPVVTADAEGTGNEVFDGSADSLFTNEDEIPLYDLSWLKEIDLSSKGHTPADKPATLNWKDNARQAFIGSDLGRLQPSWAQLYDKDSKRVIDLYFYTDPDTDNIVKVIMNDYQESGVLRTVFYYNDGAPELICRKMVSYASDTFTIKDGAGERYYFSGDVLAGWGLVDDDEKPTNQMQFITPADDGMKAYADMNPSEKSSYDAIEKNMLNLAYTVYDALKEGGFIGSITGCVKDVAGNPMSGLRVELRSASDGVLLYAGTTDEKGKFHIYVNLDDTETILLISGGDEYKIIRVGGVNLLSGMVTAAFDQLLLINVETEVQEFTINIADALTWGNVAGTALSVDGGDAGEASYLSGAEVVIRNGIAVKSGPSVYEGTTDKDGLVTVSLASGSYTAQISLDGYETMYVTVNIGADVSSQTIYMVPDAGKDDTVVLLTWDEGDTDLDLAIAGADGEFIIGNGNTGDEGSGYYLASDNTYGCEYVVLNTSNFENYRVYVRDYTNSESGNYTSTAIYNVHVHIYIICDGVVTEYYLPSGNGGVVWEVAEITGSRTTSLSRVYSEFSGTSYWISSKSGFIGDDILYKYENGMLPLLDTLIILSSEDNIKYPLGNEELCWYLGLESDSSAYIWNCDAYEFLSYETNEAFIDGDYIQDTVYSVTGNDYSLDEIAALYDSSYVYVGEYKGKSGIYFHYPTGGCIESFSRMAETVEYYGNNTWVLDVEYEFNGFGILQDIKGREVKFYLTPDAKAMGGYRLTDLEVVDDWERNTDWKAAYYDVIASGLYTNSAWETWQVRLVSVNDDCIPEMVVNNNMSSIDIYSYDPVYGCRMIYSTGYGTWGRSAGTLIECEGIINDYVYSMDDTSQDSYVTRAYLVQDENGLFTGEELYEEAIVDHMDADESLSWSCDPVWSPNMPEPTGRHAEIDLNVYADEYLWWDMDSFQYELY